MKHRYFFFLIVLLFSNFLFAQQTKYQKDFNEFWNDVNDNYAYLDQQKINWKKVREIYEPKVATINSNNEFISFLEQVIGELHNGHSSLNTNLATSNKLIPSGQDLYIEQIGNQFIVSDIKKDSKAEKSGLKIGMQVINFNKQPIEPQLQKFLPKFTTIYDPKMKQYALDMLFAGTHDKKREIEIIENKSRKTYFPDEYPLNNYNALLDFKILNKNTVYIKINNSLGNNNLISEFDTTIDRFLNYKNLMLDLTDTPSGGNTTVARAIMGRFVNKELPYQKHILEEKSFGTKRIWVEYVSPRKSQFKGKLTVLVGHWTGSMGEGMAIGFDGMNRAKIIGTKMAGLLGAVSNFGMAETKIGYQFPTERLYHINGTAREDFLPKILKKNSQETFEIVNKLTKK